MVKLNSYNDLMAQLQGKEKVYLLLYKKGNEKSDCAFNNIASACKNVGRVHIFYADVNTVRDIHPRFNIMTVPVLMEFEKSIFKNIIKGCNAANYYKVLFEEAVYYNELKKDEKPVKRVIVYSSPACSWCNTLKAYLRQHRIHFTDIDISLNQRVADELVKRSGQMGVPMTDINGEITVGFNKARINELLGIKG